MLSSQSFVNFINFASSSFINHFFNNHFIQVEQLHAVISNFLAISTALAYQFFFKSDSIANK
jgi:hypothetical protein